METLTPKLCLRGVEKTFWDKKGRATPVLDQVSFDVRDQEFLVLLGPGLCGKSVLLQLIAGLDEPTAGQILLDGQPIQDPTPKVSMVFQKTGLLAWKTVLENVEIGPKYAGVPREERRRTARRFIEMVGLAGFENAWPRQLSGGMKQRVGIARAYAAAPELLVLDEPFGALDAQTRYVMEEEILRIWEQEKKTVIFVTNNIEEAVYLGDRVVLLSSCPARVKNVYPIRLPRPRDMLSAEFLALREEISAAMDLSV